MAKIIVNNPRQVINGGAKKYYFKVKGLGGPKGDKGDKGDTGATGPQGPQGNAATVSIGSTTTLPVGYDATVTNSGSIYNAVLNFGIPQGPRGPQGATGATGAKGDKGDQGNPGPQGEKGTNATVYIGTTTTLNPGSQATVYNSGTDSNAVLNFGIPKGEKGDTGPMPTIAQSTGQVTDQVMSQKATTDALNTKQATITSSNKLSADLVTDTSTTNKFVTASDITNWNAKQDALTAGTGIDITGDVISTPAIVPEVVAELPTTGAEGKLYLTPKAHTTSTATGNPIEATITAQAGQLESFQLDGDTFQQSYEGKNLLVYPYYNTTKSPSGITFTDNGDGSITINGTLTGPESLFWLTRDIWAYSTENIVVPAGTYTISPTGISNVRLYVSAYGETQGLLASVDASTAAATFTVSEKASLTIRISVKPQGVIVNHLVVKPQLESGSTSTDFEPFVGGQASPSPEYPQPIQTVTGENVVKIYGKNLFDPDTSKTYGYLDSRGQIYVGGSHNEACFDFMPVKENTTYTFKIFETSDTISDIYWFGIGAYRSASDFSFISMPFRGGTETRPYVTFTTPTGCNYIRISGRYLLHATKLQLELGSTATTTYEPYQYRNYPLDLGDIELCKLGTYQDYIYKDGDSWKVHKATASYRITGQESDLQINTSQTNTARFFSNTALSATGAAPGGNSALILCNRLERDTTIWSTDVVGIYVNQAAIVGRMNKTTIGTTVEAARSYFANNPTLICYQLATPTDTTITDQTLIAQLEAISTASLQNSTNIIGNTATGSNLAGDMEIGYYGFSSRNHYDKWLWLDIDNEYEQIADIVSVDTIQYNPNMRSVAHQGYSTTSQTYGNSRLSSYIGAKKHGFDYGECDIQFSSDGVPVCCHDASFSSDGTTVVIAEHTLAELKTYNYYGETIASLDEVVKLCKELGLGLYIDHLNGNWSDAYWNTLFAIVNKYQMQDNVYWLQGIARSVSERILSWYNRAKLVLVINASDLTSAITEANAIKTDLNEVSIDFNYTQVTVAQMQSYAAQLKTGVQLEIWTVDNATDYKSYLPYARGITSNKICYNDVYEDL